MTGYFRAMDDFCTDPVTGDRRAIDYLFFGFMILFSPILLPLYYLGMLGSLIQRKEERE